MGDPWSEESDDLAMVRTATIIRVAMLSGMLMFAGVVLVVSRPAWGPPGMLGIVFLVMTATLLGARAMVLSAYDSAATRQLDEQAPEARATTLRGAYQSRTIVAGAMLEGAAFANLVGALVERNGIGLVVAGALALAMMVDLPTLNRYRDWVESRGGVTRG